MKEQHKPQIIYTQSEKQIQNQHESKLEQLILDLNRTGLQLIYESNFQSAIVYLKKAQKIVCKEVIPHQTNFMLVQLSGITFNNLACYYKKTKKPKVALKYLKKALQIQVFKLSNWTSIAGTHLNICAIYSFMKNHQEAANHAELAISFLQKISFNENDNSDSAKSYWNVHMLAYYNLAIEKEYLKEYQNAIKCFKKSKQMAQNSGKRNISILISCDQAICRLEPMVQNLRKKMILSIKKKHQADQKGYASYINFNKKNYGSIKQNEYYSNAQNEQKIENYLKKIANYNNTPTTTVGNRFKIRKNAEFEKGQSSNFHKKNHSLTSFHRPNQPRIRIMTQNDINQRNQSKNFQTSKFIKLHQLPKQL